MAKIITEAQREEARVRVAAYVKLRQNQTNKKTAGLRKIAAEMPQEMAKALTEMGSSSQTWPPFSPDWPGTLTRLGPTWILTQCRRRHQFASV